jgi:hypothetical protein
MRKLERSGEGGPEPPFLVTGPPPASPAGAGARLFSEAHLVPIFPAGRSGLFT